MINVLTVTQLLQGIRGMAEIAVDMYIGMAGDISKKKEKKKKKRT